MKQSNKGLKIALFFYCILFALDLAITLNFRSLIPYLEANPTFKFGGFAIVIMINLFFTIIAALVYIKKDVSYRFYFLYILMTINMARIFAIWNNIEIYLNRPSLEAVKQMAPAVLEAAQKTALIKLVVFALLPYLVGAFTFLLFKLDHEIKIKNV